MIKRILAVWLLLCILLSLSACNRQTDSIEQQGIKRLESIEELTLTVNGITIKGGMTLRECVNTGLFLYSPEPNYKIQSGHLIGVLMKVNESDEYTFTINIDSQKLEDSDIMDGIVVGFQALYREKPKNIDISICGLNEHSEIQDFEKLLGPKDDTIVTLGTGYMWYDTELKNSNYSIYGCVTKLPDEEMLNSIVIQAQSALLYDE